MNFGIYGNKRTVGNREVFIRRVSTVVTPNNK